MTPEIYHIPALLEDSINGLNIKPDGIYADVTFGGGGHSRAILGKLGDNGHLFGFDRDSDALKNAPDDPRLSRKVVSIGSDALAFMIDSATARGRFRSV